MSSLAAAFPSARVAVVPCRSDKTRSGMARYGHLADGRLKLVLVRQCSPLQVGAVRRMPGQRLQGTEALRSTRL